MNKLIAGILTLIVSLSVSAQEAPRACWMLGGSLLTFDDSVGSIEPIQEFGRPGYDFNANIGIGVEGGFSLVDDEIAGVDFDVLRHSSTWKLAYRLETMPKYMQCSV